jgi:nucleoid-associated protein YgaU
MEAVLESLEALELGDKELAQALLMSLDDSISSSSDSEDADMAAAVAASLEDQDTADADLAQAIKASLADEKAKGKQPANLEQQMAQLTHAGTAGQQLAGHCRAVCVPAQCCVSGRPQRGRHVPAAPAV